MKYLNMDKLLSLSRNYKRLISILIDSIFICSAFWLAYFLRLSSLTDFNNPQHWQVLACLIPLTIVINIKFGLYRAIIRFFSFQALRVIVKSVFLSSVALVVLSLVFDSFLPRSVPIIFGFFLFVFSAGSRLSVRNWVNSKLSKGKSNILILGAGATGRQLIQTLQAGNEFNPIAFIDQKEDLIGLTIDGFSVYPISQLPYLIKDHQVTHILLAIPKASRKQKIEIIQSLKDFNVEILSIPRMSDVVSGKAKIDDLIEIPIEEILGRDPVSPKPELLKANIEQKVVMVTGAGGSIGSELCRQIIKHSPKELVLFDSNEFNLYQIEQELGAILSKNLSNIKVHAVLGNVQNKQRVEQVLQSLTVQTLYHTAAYKHVPLVENNVVEGIKNNIFGTLNTAKAAIEANVETFVLISSDKAVRPTNIMGTTKRIAEHILLSIPKNNSSTRFCIVRFGNVLGSSGSVIPLFKQQIKQGGPITVTHKEVTRYFMSIPEAAQLVIQAGAMGQGGEIYLLNMGEPVKIYELAKNMIRLSGLQVRNTENPEGDIDILITGLREGEKLYEELLVDHQSQATDHKLIMRSNESCLNWQTVEPVIKKLEVACERYDLPMVRKVLLSASSDFKPVSNLCDIVYLNQK